MRQVGHVLFCPQFHILFARLLDEHDAPHPENLELESLHQTVCCIITEIEERSQGNFVKPSKQVEKISCH